MTREEEQTADWRQLAARELRTLGDGDRRLAAALRVLAADIPSARDALLDAHSESLRERLLAVYQGIESGVEVKRRVALLRLLEEARGLTSRKAPLGRGFERLFESRLRGREEQRRSAPQLLELLDRFELGLLREPGSAVDCFEDALARPLSLSERRWLEDERRVRTLEFVRRDKTDGEGHICWYVARDERHGYRLARLGRPGFHVESSVPPRAPLRMSSRRVARLVYVPSTIPHQLGGVPEVGAAFLVSRLRDQGWRAESVQLMEAEFDQGLSSLLAADVVGVGVYVHNVREVGELLRRLRRAGFTGAVVLGGPEARNIGAVRAATSGWDAIIRGEGEEVLPEVLSLLEKAEQRGREWVVARARRLRGVLIRWRDLELSCDTLYRNRASEVLHPLPFGWSRDGRRKLKMNFSRGCPYLCSFCPNHQGRAFRAATVENTWRFAVLAVADDIVLPIELQRELSAELAERLGETVGPLEAALDRYIVAREEEPRMAPLGAVVEQAFSKRLSTDPGTLLRERLECSLPPRRSISTDGDRYDWLGWKAALLAEVGPDARRRFVIETSEDNTLVNREEVREFLARRKRSGLARAFVFNPGQNTIRDLMDGKRVAGDYLDLLVDDNPFEIAFGADGTSNPVLRQNRKPGYGVADIVALHRAVRARGVRAEYNYILLTPETTLLEAVESFLLFLLLPIPWRDYDDGVNDSINLRVITEETTLATDEGILFAPDDESWYVPIRDPELSALLDRHGLSSEIPSKEIRLRLAQVLADDEEVRALVPLVVERWKRDFDKDAELVALAGRLEGLGVDEILSRAASVSEIGPGTGDPATPMAQPAASLDGR